MLFHESKDESAWGLALAGFVVVAMATFLGNVTGDVQPKAPIVVSHPDVSSPDLRDRKEAGESNTEASPYPSSMSPAASQ